MSMVLASDRMDRHAIWVLAGLSLCVLGVVLALKGLLADVLYRGAQTPINRWTNTATLPANSQELADVEGVLRLASQLQPSSPSIHDDLGRLYSLATHLRDVPFPEKRRYGERALAEHREAIRLRPTHPYGWVNLLLVKGWLGQTFDQEFKVALAKGTEYGPWEPELHRSVIGLGLSIWPNLSPDQQNLVMNLTDRAMKVQPDQIIKIAERARRLPLVCDHFQDKSELAKKKCLAAGGR